MAKNIKIKDLETKLIEKEAELISLKLQLSMKKMFDRLDQEAYIKPKNEFFGFTEMIKKYGKESGYIYNLKALKVRLLSLTSQYARNTLTMKERQELKDIINTITNALKVLI